MNHPMKKGTPAGTTLAAKPRVPIKERSSRLVQWVQRDHLAREDLMSCSLSTGSQASRADESRRISRYSSSVVGPSHLSSAVEMLSCSQRHMRVLRCREHCIVFGGACDEEII